MKCALKNVQNGSKNKSVLIKSIYRSVCVHVDIYYFFLVKPWTFHDPITSFAICLPWVTQCSVAVPYNYRKWRKALIKIRKDANKKLDMLIYRKPIRLKRCLSAGCLWWLSWKHTQSIIFQCIKSAGECFNEAFVCICTFLKHEFAFCKKWSTFLKKLFQTRRQTFEQLGAIYFRQVKLPCFSILLPNKVMFMILISSNTTIDFQY